MRYSVSQIREILRASRYYNNKCLLSRAKEFSAKEVFELLDKRKLNELIPDFVQILTTIIHSNKFSAWTDTPYHNSGVRRIMYVRCDMSNNVMYDSCDNTFSIRIIERYNGALYFKGFIGFSLLLYKNGVSHFKPYTGAQLLFGWEFRKVDEFQEYYSKIINRADSIIREVEG